MPANVTPEYLAAERRYRLAKNSEEKLTCLQEMLSTVPKHKGTEKLQAEIKTKISKLKKELMRKPGAKRTIWYHFDKQGAGQVVVIGGVNVGKSSLVKLLTNAPTEVREYPFSTVKPIAGMLSYEDIQIQMIDTPPLIAAAEPWLFSIIRNGDLLIWVIDLSQDNRLELVNTRNILEILAQHRISLTPSSELTYKKTIVVGNKSDLPEAKDHLASLLKEFNFKVIPVSVVSKENIEFLKTKIFESLEIIRIYTKKPGYPPDLTDPIILQNGKTVLDAARYLHKEFAANLKYARLWNGNEYKGQMVEKRHILKDRDIIEFHI